MEDGTVKTMNCQHHLVSDGDNGGCTEEVTEQGKLLLLNRRLDGSEP